MSKLPADMVGQEFDWFAVDRDGHVGHFSSAGFGPIPEVAVLARRDYQAIQRHFLEQQGISPVKLLRDDQGNYTDWITIASNGIFSYDFEHWNGLYRLLAVPLQPTHISLFPKPLQEVIVKISFDVLCFESNPAIDPQQEVGNINWVV